MNDFIKAIGNQPTEKIITAYFKNGQRVDYTMAIFKLLKTDKDVAAVIDGDTGEVLYSA